jgi:hypothetical protein
MALSSVGDTAALLIAADKESWITEREEKVHAKGKGELQTYWVQIKAGSQGDGGSTINGMDESHNASNLRSLEVASEAALKDGTKQGTGISRFGNTEAMMERMAMIAKSKRLVEWNTEILAKILKQIMVRRAARKMKKIHLGLYLPTTQKEKEVVDISFDRAPPKGHPIDAVIDIISLPHFDAKSFSKHVNPDSIEVPDVVMAQLTSFVGNIAELYQLNAFHNFEVGMCKMFFVNISAPCLLISIVHFL